MPNDSDLLDFAIRNGLCPSREALIRMKSEKYWQDIAAAAAKVAKWPNWKRGLPDD